MSIETLETSLEVGLEPNKVKEGDLMFSATPTGSLSAISFNCSAYQISSTSVERHDESIGSPTNHLTDSRYALSKYQNNGQKQKYNALITLYIMDNTFITKAFHVQLKNYI